MPASHDSASGHAALARSLPFKASAPKLLALCPCMPAPSPPHSTLDPQANAEGLTRCGRHRESRVAHHFKHAASHSSDSSDRRHRAKHMQADQHSTNNPTTTPQQHLLALKTKHALHTTALRAFPCPPAMIP